LQEPITDPCVIAIPLTQRTDKVMKIKFLIFSIFSLLAFTDCTKSSGPSSVSGQVVDNTTGKGVPYAQVFVVGASGGTIGALGNQQSGTATADANGNFSISFNWAGGNNYSVTAQSQFYFQSQAISDVSINAGKNSNIKIPMVPKGFVRFYLVNSHPLDTVFDIVIDDFNNTPGISNICKDTSYVVYGFGNTMTHFSYKIYKYDFTNGSIYYDSIYVKALDTVTFTINY